MKKVADKLVEERVELVRRLDELQRRKYYSHSKDYDADIAATKLRLFEIRNQLKELKEN